MRFGSRIGIQRQERDSDAWSWIRKADNNSECNSEAGNVIRRQDKDLEAG